jgi:kynurenine formamidase
MNIIDLTLPLHTGMPVYPGDPEVSIERILFLDTDDWEMRRMEINSHDGTHVNAQVHALANGKNLDAYPLTAFCGQASIFTSLQELHADRGVIFRDQTIDASHVAEILSVRPRFVGLAAEFDIDPDLEKQLLVADIIVYERLANTYLLPDTFMFYGMPLHILEGDGSPVRAFAVVEG